MNHIDPDDINETSILYDRAEGSVQVIVTEEANATVVWQRNSTNDMLVYFESAHHDKEDAIERGVDLWREIGPG